MEDLKPLCWLRISCCEAMCGPHSNVGSESFAGVSLSWLTNACLDVVQAGDAALLLSVL